MKKNMVKLMELFLIVGLMAGCGNGSKQGQNGTAANLKEITIVSREDGSGTRGAFVELFGIEEKDADGNKVDHTTEEANICNSTSVVMTTVEGDEAAIGYISLGSLNDTVKAVAIDGVEATAENVKEGSYKISRPFIIVTKGEVGEAAQDFITYILSTEGQQVVQKAGYIPLDDTANYNGKNASGKVVVAGSSSVTPVMEKLKEAYLSLNPSAEIEIQESDSTTGINGAIDGICDIGMASRALKDSEVEAGLKDICIAMDGIAVIVNKGNSKEALSSDSVKKIYTGEVTSWEEVQ